MNNPTTNFGVRSRMAARPAATPHLHQSAANLPPDRPFATPPGSQPRPDGRSHAENRGCVRENAANFLPGPPPATLRGSQPCSDEHSHFRRQAGFSAIELVGVLTIIALMAAALIPNLIRRIDHAAWTRETADLKVMARGLVQTVLRDKIITNEASLSVAISRYLDMAPAQVTATPRGFIRRFLVDPNLNLNGITAAGLPFIQTNAAWSLPPANARVLMLSTIATPDVATISDTFASIWDTPPGGKPSTWTGKGEDLCIERVDLGSLFRKVYLLNIDPTNAGNFTFEFNPPSAVANAGGQRTAYVLDGSSLSLFAGGTNNLQMRVIIRQDESFVYQDNRWGRSLFSGKQDLGLDEFGTWIERFLNACPPTNPKFGATQRAIVDEFYNYMWGYWSWGQSGFAGRVYSGNAAPQNPFFRTVYDSQRKLADFTYNLVN